MAELLTSAQMRAIEAAAISSGAVTGLELMERAGQGVVDAVFAEWPELAKTSHRAVVLCGPGNNGGDGFVIARLLKEWGWAVEVFLYGDAEKLPPDARVNYERWVELGEVRALRMADVDLFECDLAVDALFGTGLTRPLRGEAMRAANALATRAWGDDPVVAVDAPSGMCMDAGRALAPPEGDGVAAAGLTVSFHALKLGHVLAEGPERCGKAVVADIGLDRHTALVDLGAAADAIRGQRADRAVVAVQIRDADFEPGSFAGDTLPKTTGGHKFAHGHALILAGPSGKGGAGRLAARGALRIGAGLVTLGCSPDAVAENAARLDAVMLAPVADSATLARVLEDERISALCLGPGLGLERARELVPVALGNGGVKPRPTVLDADALSAFGDDPAALFGMLHDTCVLTPHAGEFARLFPDIAEKLNAPATKGPAYSKVDATRAAAKRAGCVVLFKGPDTVIADQNGRASINSAAYERAAPWLATAGSGDVLAGFVTGLLARGFAPMQAAETAAWLHVEAARAFGPGLIAEDLPEQLPKAFRSLGL